MNFKTLYSLLDETLSEDEIFSDGEIDFKSFDVQKKLCPVFWDKNLNLREDIRQRLLKIAKDFSDKIDFTEIFPGKNLPSKSKFFKDVLFVGSLASYNYSDYSDIDLHIVVDLEFLNLSEIEINLFKKYFWFVKDNWNKNHPNLKIEGYDIEIYVQDKNEKNAANGIYSLLKNKWLKVPKTMDGKFDRNYVAYVSKNYMDEIDKMEKILNMNPSNETLQKIIDRSQKIKDKIVQSRRDSLGKDSNEFSNDNIVFKVLRRSGHMEKLNSIMNKAYDIANTLKGKI